MLIYREHIFLTVTLKAAGLCRVLRHSWLSQIYRIGNTSSWPLLLQQQACVLCWGILDYHKFTGYGTLLLDRASYSSRSVSSVEAVLIITKLQDREHSILTVPLTAAGLCPVLRQSWLSQSYRRGNTSYWPCILQQQSCVLFWSSLVIHVPNICHPPILTLISQ
jgi:hypothetical protein